MGEKKEDNEGVLFYLLLVSEMHHGDRNLAEDEALEVSSMAGRQKLTVNQITDDLGYEKAWNLWEKKESDEGFRFISY